MTITLAEYLADLESLVGVPYAHAGRSRLGLDCVGVPILPLIERGFPVVDQTNYPRQAFSGSLVRALEAQAVAIGISEAGPGDVLLFWCDRGNREPQHVASLLGDGMVVHALKPVGRVVRTHLGGWSRRITHAFRVPPTMVVRG